MKMKGWSKMAPFIADNIGLVSCLAVASDVMVSVMGLFKMAAWTEHGMQSKMARYIDRFGKMGIDREGLDTYARSYRDESRHALMCWMACLAVSMVAGLVPRAFGAGTAVLLFSVPSAAVSIRCIVMAVKDMADIRDVLAETGIGAPNA